MLYQIDNLRPFLALLARDPIQRVLADRHEFGYRSDVACTHVLLHQRMGLLLQGVVHINPVRICLSYHVVDGRKSGIILDEGAHEGIRRDDFVEHRNLFKFPEKLLTPFLVAEMFDEAVDIAITEVTPDETGIRGRLLLHLIPEQYFEQADVSDNRLDLFAVESQRFFELVEEVYEVEHQTLGFDHSPSLVLIRSVYPRNGLQQRVVPHGLVQVHGIEDRRIEAGEQLLGDDEDFRLHAESGKVLKDLLLLFLIKVVFLQLHRIVVIAGKHDLRIIRR